ncbi:hypothetical protein FV768_23670 [Vibrio parahaemolyticus]|jgi:hypothetical protein|uniref:hypothetical protein n=1 Tax=Vibrio parahaemolyticus TaxID=670 RepID=UPI00100E26E2|nr:hypothetical protein [Vibrio parahaemolyticus]EGQ9818919.1 hypothetical protein [Vibrio parahaemolyticus]RXP53098.1 hypothetical protein EGL72_25185 [Vibrio parahaemolyticus]RXP65330.1 hypothetical protein EGL71_25360 [Vibrio parahaemolyticus]RXP91018.1 hypothetical protein EGL68_25555 [Vibrio parahaemolyticus]RXQ11529.1 hypothetical protein EGL65_25470 [Vibrio parahaemolyticus]
MSTKFLVTNEKEAEDLLKLNFRTKPIAAGRDPRTGWRFWYIKGKRVVMKANGTQTANGMKQYLVTVE